MKFLPVIATLAILAAVSPPAEAARSRHHSHNHRAHIRHSRFVGRANLRSRTTLHPIAPPPLPVAAVEYGPAHPITGLPLPPEGDPEFGQITAVSIRTAAIISSASHQPSVADLTAQKSKLVQLAMLRPPASTKLPLAVSSPTPLAIPSPEAPEVVVQPRFNHPTPVPLPESPAVQPGTNNDAPATVIPEHEDDDQPISMMTGGYVALPRKKSARPFQELVPMRGYDVAASGTGVFDHTVSSSGIQNMDAAAGLFLTFHRHSDRRWLDLEAHYGINQTSAQYVPVGSQNSVTSSLLSQELTGDFLLRKHLNRAKPYQALPYFGFGGGMLFLRQSTTGNTSFTPTGVIDSGVDIPTNNQHIAFRVGSHLLFFPTPNLGNSAASGWTFSAQPAAGVLFHF